MSSNYNLERFRITQKGANYIATHKEGNYTGVLLRVINGSPRRASREYLLRKIEHMTHPITTSVFDRLDRRNSLDRNLAMLEAEGLITSDTPEVALGWPQLEAFDTDFHNPGMTVKKLAENHYKEFPNNPLRLEPDRAISEFYVPSYDQN